MDINLFNDRKNGTLTVSIISDIPVMKELILAVIFPFAKICEKGADITVVCTKKAPPEVKGPCIYVGSAPKNLSDMQIFMPRPLDIEAFSSECLSLFKKMTVTTESGWAIDEKRQVAIFGENEVSLTLRECQLFALLLSRIGECVSREEMDTSLWNGETAGNCCDVYICYLRKKLEKIAGPGVLISVRGKGYMLKKP